MSTWMYPVGPEPPSTYWWRRIGVLVVILVILGLVWFLLFGRGGGSGSAGPSPSPSPSSASPSASPSPTLSPTGSPTASPTASGSPTSTGVTDCKDSVIEVEASTNDSTYAVGSTPKLTLKVTNGGNVACLRDVGAGANELKISSGGVPVWSSDDCNTNDASDIVTLEPGESFSTTVTWNGRLSEEGCPDGEPTATAGSYDLVGRNGKIESDPSTFELV